MRLTTYDLVAHELPDVVLQALVLASALLLALWGLAGSGARRG
jgi:hypothetical protein